MRWEVREKTDGRKSWDLRGQREIRKDKKKEKKKKERGASEKDFFFGGDIIFEGVLRLPLGIYAVSFSEGMVSFFESLGC